MKSDVYIVNAAERICGISLHKEIFCSLMNTNVISHPQSEHQKFAENPDIAFDRGHHQNYRIGI